MEKLNNHRYVFILPDNTVGCILQSFPVSFLMYSIFFILFLNFLL